MKICSSWARPISLRQALPETEIAGPGDLEIIGCSSDSRRVRLGELFAALAGTAHDGHDHVAEAAARGCAAVLAQRPVDPCGVPIFYVPDSREAYGRICQALAGYPAAKLKVIGVTGTNGKTTTTWLIASILHLAGHSAGVLGTLGCFDGYEHIAASLTTPPPEELARSLARMVDNGCSHAIVEVSSHALDQRRLAGIALDAACITNVRRDHLDYHPSLRDYRLAKTRVFDYVSGEGFAVLNADDAASAAWLAQVSIPALTVGMSAAAEITGTLIERHTSEQTFLLTAGSETLPVRTRMIGTHHVYNCLAAAAVGLAYGIDLVTVVRGLEAVETLPGRLQRIECGQSYGVFVDFAHTPDALTGCLESLREAVAGRLICVFGAGGDRDRQKRPLMGRAVELAADVAVVTSDNPRSEDPEEIAAEILSGMRCPEKARLVLDRREAIAWALAQARPGDCVLIAGKGHENCQIIGQARHPFDDAEVARRWLYENQPEAA